MDYLPPNVNMYIDVKPFNKYDRFYEKCLVDPVLKNYANELVFFKLITWPV